MPLLCVAVHPDLQAFLELTCFRRTWLSSSSVLRSGNQFFVKRLLLFTGILSAGFKSPLSFAGGELPSQHLTQTAPVLGKNCLELISSLISPRAVFHSSLYFQKTKLIILSRVFVTFLIFLISSLIFPISFVNTLGIQTSLVSSTFFSLPSWSLRPPFSWSIASMSARPCLSASTAPQGFGRLSPSWLLQASFWCSFFKSSISLWESVFLSSIFSASQAL